MCRHCLVGSRRRRSISGNRSHDLRSQDPRRHRQRSPQSTVRPAIRQRPADDARSTHALSRPRVPPLRPCDRHELSRRPLPRRHNMHRSRPSSRRRLAPSTSPLGLVRPAKAGPPLGTLKQRVSCAQSKARMRGKGGAKPFRLPGKRSAQAPEHMLRWSHDPARRTSQVHAQSRRTLRNTTPTMARCSRPPTRIPQARMSRHRPGNARTPPNTRTRRTERTRINRTLAANNDRLRSHRQATVHTTTRKATSTTRRRHPLGPTHPSTARHRRTRQRTCPDGEPRRYGIAFPASTNRSSSPL